MRVGAVMTPRVISVTPSASILDAARLMLQNNVSGLPVVDADGMVVGIVTEGDFLRRAETGTERKRSRWLEFLMGPGQLADDYVHSHGRKVEEVMTPDPATITEDAPLDDAVMLMERHRIKRLPVVRGRRLVGILSRANLMYALASLAGEIRPSVEDDSAVRDRVLAAFDGQPWAPPASIVVIVRNGIVWLFGTISDHRQRQALRVAAENVPGVRSVEDHTSLIKLLTGDLFARPEHRSKGVNEPKP